MEETELSIVKFLKALQEFQGACPTFSIDYKKKEIVIKDACSGFLKQLYADTRACAHLTSEGIKLTYFKD